jgi:hypothetical protein
MRLGNTYHPLVSSPLKSKNVDIKIDKEDYIKMGIYDIYKSLSFDVIHQYQPSGANNYSLFNVGHINGKNYIGSDNRKENNFERRSRKLNKNSNYICANKVCACLNVK